VKVAPLLELAPNWRAFLARVIREEDIKLLRPGFLPPFHEDGVDSPKSDHLRWTPFSIEPFAALAPGRVVKRMDGALLVELQAADDPGPLGDAWEIVG
jgi:hypothetical protein